MKALGGLQGVNLLFSIYQSLYNKTKIPGSYEVVARCLTLSRMPG